MPSANRTQLTEALIAAGRRLDALGLVPARDGNLSARLDARRILITATGTRLRELDRRSLVEVRLDGTPVDSRRPSSELGMHLAVYGMRPEVQAIVHAHPPVAVGFATAGVGLTDCLLPEVALSLGAVPLTAYATPGTPEVEAAIREAARSHDAFLLANHGAVTLGTSVDEALDRMETVEHFARITLVARLLGGGRPLSAPQVEALEALRLGRGDPRPISCTPAPGPAAATTPSPPPDSVDPAAVAEAVAEAIRAVLGPSPSDRS